jgi:hypothetical protein
MRRTNGANRAANQSDVLARAVQTLSPDAAPASGAPLNPPAREATMSSRILFSTIATATLLAAAPAFAAEGSSKQQCSCCSDGSMHDTDHPLREGAAQQKQKASTERAAQPSPKQDDPDVRNQSWGG